MDRYLRCGLKCFILHNVSHKPRRNPMKPKWAAFLLSALLCAAPFAFGQDTGSSDKKSTGSEVKSAAKTATKDTEKGAKTATKDTEKAVKKTGHATKTVAKDSEKDTKVAAKDTEKGAKIATKD